MCVAQFYTTRAGELWRLRAMRAAQADRLCYSAGSALRQRRKRLAGAVRDLRWRWRSPLVRLAAGDKSVAATDHSVTMPCVMVSMSEEWSTEF